MTQCWECGRDTTATCDDCGTPICGEHGHEQLNGMVVCELCVIWFNPPHLKPEEFTLSGMAGFYGNLIVKVGNLRKEIKIEEGDNIEQIQKKVTAAFYYHPWTITVVS